MHGPTIAGRATFATLVFAITILGCASNGSKEGRTSGASESTAKPGATANPQPPSEGTNATPPPGTSRVAMPPEGDGRVSPVLTEPRVIEGLYLRAPATWATLEPSSAMRKAEYSIPGPGGEGNFVVFFFGQGEGGGADANLERWIAQMEGPNGGPATATRSEMTVNNVSIKSVTVTGTLLPSTMSGITEKRPGWKMLGSVVEGPGGPWFLKATGPEATLDAERMGYSAMLSALRAAGE
jgi:hypothetical protein